MLGQFGTADRYAASTMSAGETDTLRKFLSILFTKFYVTDTHMRNRLGVHRSLSLLKWIQLPGSVGEKMEIDTLATHKFYRLMCFGPVRQAGESIYLNVGYVGTAPTSVLIHTRRQAPGICTRDIPGWKKLTRDFRASSFRSYAGLRNIWQYYSSFPLCIH